ncbi:hypothetical protein KIW84_055745 [Lathyrus oleraceus]|uniref:Hydroxyethylthiazole kinase n=1 Tax=Pisum sativum TaxID=3888 RepID=A0A9D4WYY8_PEA|nr:hypothetical protein KIW84_055745 [Pisum sativum]
MLDKCIAELNTHTPLTKGHAFDAAVSTLVVFGVAGELGMKMAKGPASLRMHLIDALYGLDEATLQSHVNITSSS